MTFIRILGPVQIEMKYFKKKQSNSIELLFGNDFSEFMSYHSMRKTNLKLIYSALSALQSSNRNFSTMGHLNCSAVEMQEVMC